METKIAIVQFLFTKNWKVLSDSLGANPALTSHSFSTSPEVMKFCAEEQNCLIIASVASKEDLIQLATFVKGARRNLRETILKIVVVNATENKQFEKAIAKLGSVEILEPSVSVKALRFKMDFWMKAMRGQAKKLGSLTQKTLEKSPTEVTQELKSLVQNPPLECENDIWLLTKESDCKRIIGRWMVKLMGPSPYVGLWNEVPNKQDIWTFSIKKTFADQFVNGQGTWVFKGEQKPEYNWQENRWMFTGEEFELFYSNEGTILSKVKLAAKVLTISGNSLFAKTKEPLIVESFNKDLIFKKEAELLKGQTLDFENEGDLGGNLEGKVKEKEQKSKGQIEGKLKEKEETSKGQLEGKFKDQEQKKGNLHGKVKDKEASVSGHLEGEIHEQEESSGNLHGKVKDQEARHKGQLEGKVSEQEEKKKNLEGKLKDKEDSLEGHLEGKLKDREASLDGNLEGKIKDRESSQSGHLEGEVKGKEAPKNDLKGKIEREDETWYKKPEKKKHEQVTDEIDSKWKGKSSKDSSKEEAERESHKQHNEKIASEWGGDVKQYSAEEKAERKRQEVEAADRGPGLKGKNDKTDHLDAHWGGKNSSEKVQTNGLSAPGSADVKEGSLLDLKKTENEYQSHYKNHNETAQFEAGELGKNQYKDGEDGSLGGKTSTDKLASHYGNGQKSEFENKSQSGPLAGGTETDKLAKHLGHKNSDRAGQESEGKDSPAALKGKTSTEKLKSHYGSGKKAGAPVIDLPANKELESITFDLGEVVNDFEESNATPAATKFENVLPFPKPEEEKDIEKLTANALVHTYVIQNNKKHECKLDDFFDNSAIFISNDGGFKVSEKAQLDINLAYQAENARINCEGVVTSVDENGSGGFYVTIQVKISDSVKFDRFMELMKSRQDNIQSFMQKARGL